MGKNFCEARVANYYGDFEVALQRYSSHFAAFPGGRREVRKYFLLEDENRYLLMASHSDTPIHDYNVVLSVMGPGGEQVKKKMAGFEKKTMIGARPAPDHVYRAAEAIMRFFEELKS